jgi:hypothetical protein
MLQIVCKNILVTILHQVEHAEHCSTTAACFTVQNTHQACSNSQATAISPTGDRQVTTKDVTSGRVTLTQQQQLGWQHINSLPQSARLAMAMA